MLTQGELFAGCGGWAEAAKMSGGIKTIWRSEIHAYKNKVYDLRHPGVPNLGDITTIVAAPTYADIITCSFPCTGISIAGKGEGLEDKNSRLWFKAKDIIGLCRPQYVVIENSPILNSRGLHRILGALAAFGYDAEWTHLSGTQFGIQQRRKKIYLIAYPNQTRQPRVGGESIFRQLQIRNVNNDVFPGWPNRGDIPEPRTFRSTNDFPALIHRLECIGDAIIPLIGCYIFECIKLHYYGK